MSHNMEGVEGQDSIYGSLTTSLIYPSAVPFPPMPPPGWQGPVGWPPSNRTVENGFPNFYQGHMMGGAPNYMYNESGVVPYDEGDEDFYENQQQWEPRGGAKAADDERINAIQEAQSEAITPSSRGTPVGPQSAARADLLDTRKENQKPTTKDGKPVTSAVSSDRAAELRAKLLAIRSANGSTPGPELKTKTDTRVTGLGTTSAANGNKADSKSKANSVSGNGGLGISAQPDIRGMENASERFDLRESEAEIEGLFAEARAAVEAQKTTGQIAKNQVKGNDNPSVLSAKKGSQVKPEITRRPSLNNSVKSLDASEQGEIREDTSNSRQASQSGEAERPRQSEAMSKIVNPERFRQPTGTADYTASRKKDTDTDMANGVGDRPSPTSSRPREGSISSRKASTDTQSQLKTAIQRSREDHLTQAERLYRAARDIHVSPKDSERERERKATEYKRELESYRQRPAEVRTAPDQDVEDRRRSRQTAISNMKAFESRPNGTEAQVARDAAAEDSNEDLEDWLQMTGYHDRSYRKKALDRHRKLIALETQKAELEREAQLEYEERAQISRAQSVLPRESIESDLSRAVFSPQNTRTSSVTIMPPPPIPIKQTRDAVRLKIKDLAGREPSSSRRSIEDELRPLQHVDTLSPVEASSLKRHHISDDRELEELRPADKLVRLDANGRAVRRAEIEHDRVPIRASSVSHERRMTLDDSERSRNGYKEHTSGNNELDRHSYQVRGRPASPYAGADRQRLRSLSPTPRRMSGQDTFMTDGNYPDDLNIDRVSRSPRQVVLSRDSSPPRRAQNIRYDEYRDEPPMHRYYEEKSKLEPKYRTNYEQDYFPNRGYDHNQYISSRGRGGGRGRGGYYGGRGGYKPFKREEEQHGNSFQNQPLDLRAGDSRFFLIKSWNYDNVVAAQRDETWVTQEKNLEILVDAFNTCRHVILAFSVNKSVAFQGYARMESLPGTVEKPAWARELHWATSPPFRIRWITMAETRSSRVHHIKNSLNENQGVHVGRDGQEIEEQCGILLCEIMDEEERKMRMVNETY